MFCKNCGTKLNENVRFCQECGTKVQNTDSEPETVVGNATGDSSLNTTASSASDSHALEQTAPHMETESEAEYEVEYPSPLKIKIYYLLACAGAIVWMIGSIAYWLELEPTSGHHYGPGRVKLSSGIFDFCANVPGWIPEMFSTVFFTLLAFEFRKYLLQFDLSKQLRTALQVMLGVAVAAVVWNLVTEAMDDFLAIYVGYIFIAAAWVGIGQALRKSEITPLGTWFLAAGITSFFMFICYMIYELRCRIGDPDTESLTMLAAILVVAVAVCECKVFIEMGKYLGADDDDDTEE